MFLLLFFSKCLRFFEKQPILPKFKNLGLGNLSSGTDFNQYGEKKAVLQQNNEIIVVENHDVYDHFLGHLT